MVALLVAPAALAQSPLLRFENLDGAPFPDRLVMSRIGTLASPPPANGVHDVSKVRLSNDGTAALTVSSLTLAGPFQLVTTPALPFSLPAGGSTDLSVRFVAETGSLQSGTRGFHSGTLTVGSNDPTRPSAAVALRGYWQNLSENNREPKLNEMVGSQLFGYGTQILGSGQVINSRGRIERVGDEVVSPYWRLADAGQPVTVRQLAAYHGCCTDAAPLYWHARGSTATTQVVRHNATDGQTLLPRRAGSTTALTVGTFAPGAGTVFGFRVAGNEWSDPFRNDPTPDDCSSGVGTCGQHVRFWPAKDPSGAPIPNTYIMGMDYAGINYDFNDNVYLVSNVTPAEAVATSGTVRLNAGGLGVTTGGVAFGASQFATNGQGYTPTCDLGDIAGTTDDDLYRTELEPVTGSSPKAFALNVPVPNGEYTVRLHFAEIYWGSCGAPAATVGKRVFSVTMEGQSVLTDLDIFAEVGVRRALVKTFQTTVTGNMLNVSFLASKDNPMLSAIEIVPGVTDLPPARPTALVATGSTGGVALDWADNTESDLVGYTVHRSAIAGGPYVALTSTPVTTSAFSDGTLASGERAFYVVRAVDVGGNVSDASAEVHATRQVPATTFTTVNWGTVAAQPLGNSEAQAAVVGGKLYSFGGFDVEKKNGACNCFTPTPRAYVYDPAAGTGGTWTPLAPLPHTNGGGVTHAGITTDGVDVFFAGGYIANAARTGQIFGTNQVWRYNTATNTYTALPNLPAERASGQLTYFGGKLYFIGGANKARTQDVGNVYVLDYAAFKAGQTVTWGSAAALPNPRTHMGGVVLNNLIYAVGGQHGRDEELVTQASVHAYDPASNTWAPVASLPQALSHISGATYVHEGRIIVLGGERAHTSFVNTAYAYNPATNAWATLTPLPVSRASGVGGSLGGSLYYSTGNFNRPTYQGTPGTPNQPPTAAFTATPDGASPLTIHFNAGTSSDPDGAIASYAWSFGDGTPDGTTGPTIDHTYATNGTYTIVLTVTDNNGATATASQTLTVLASASRPFVTGTLPASGATGVLRNAYVAVDVSLPNVGYGIDAATLTAATVRLYPTGDPASAVVAQLNTSAGGDAVVLQPTTLLGANVAYTFEVTEGLRDLAGQPFLPFTSTFTTGSLPTGAPPSNVQFQRVSLSAATPSVVGQHSSLAIGPDGRLYATTIQGSIKRWDIAADGSLSNLQTYNTVRTMNGGTNRLLVGLAFDPASTAADPILWVTHSTFGFNNVPDWGGKLTRLSGVDFATAQDVLVNLPRSIRDHATNSVAFGPDGALYLLQGSNSAMGDADTAWGNRPERRLSAAVLRVDVAGLMAGSLPLDVKTSEGGTYDPAAPGAPVRVFASGVRNAYDLVWHTNGDLYVPTNGSAANGRAPASVAGTIRPDGLPYNGPAVPAIDAVETQNDYLFRVAPPSGGTWGYHYYGHPNPTRGEYVLNGGNPTDGLDLAQVDRYPVGVQPDAAWGGFAYNFGRNISPNGVVEYKSNTFGGALKGKLLVVRYSGGDDIVVLTPGASRDIAPDGDSRLLVQGSELFSDPLDLIENPATGDLYVSEYGGGGQILLLRPTVNQPPVASFTVTPDPGNPLAFTFDASGSTDNGTITGYAWAFGDGTMGTGLTTSYTYASGGSYTVVLTVTDNENATGTAQQTVSAGSPGNGPFLEAGGLVVVEAENAHESIARGGQSWTQTPAAGAVGTALGALPNTGVNRNAGFVGTAPELRYRVQFSTPGTYYVWGRVLAASNDDDSFHTGIDGTGPASADRLFTAVRNEMAWTNTTMDSNSRATITVGSAGEHVISVWMREDGMILDRLLLTTNAALTPTGNGPAESTRNSNQAPVASFTATHDGEAPLSYTFDASASTDDGTITGYAWDFGDGATGTGSAPAHTYAASGTYTVALTVTDNGGATGTAQKTLVVDDGSLAVVAEAGAVTVSQTSGAQWHAVALQHAFADPVVVMGPPSSGDPEPVTVRVRNVTASGFEFQLDEWDYLDGVHGAETVAYLVAERGVHTLADGRLLEAGTTGASGSMNTAALAAPFAAAPVLLAQVVSTGSPNAVTTRLRNVTATSFQVKLQAQESTSGYGTETLAYVAIALGTTDGEFDAGRTTDRVTNTFTGITYGAPFAAAPVVVAAMQTMNGSDPSTLRTQSALPAGIQMRVEEEQSADAETSHGTEVVGYVALTAGPVYALPPPPVNQPPVPNFAATPDGANPLSYTFDASASTDDGTITGYAWDFGDGATGTGSAPAHTYAASGTYTVALTVTDNEGATATAQKTLTVNDGSLAAVAEAGSATVSQASGAQWHAVAFQRPFADPVVVMGPPSSGDPEPVTVRVRNVTASGFEFQLDEWDYLDGVHGAETVAWLAVERGAHTLADGRRVEAGTTAASGSMKTATFGSPFAAAPVVLGQIVTASRSEALTTRLRNVTATSFQVRLQTQESSSNVGQETLAYVALEPGTTPGKTDVGRTTDRVTDAFAGITYGASFAQAPLFMASMQTLNGSDPSTLRHQSASPTGIQVRVEEEQSADAETAHGTEVVGYVALPAGPLYAQPPPSLAQAASAGLLAEALPEAYALETNRPNPFRSRTTLRYALPEEASVRLTVYDALGRRVAVVVDEAQPAGWHEVSFDAGGLAAGVYVCHLEAGAFAQSQRMSIVR
ncbi:hypothetical protein BSZ37_05680 [Rubrivirga marina]|uniref:PKD domain-containing protein n=1 Tax=Rubrivirga marina TaxID=1196024 RepID=A0A271IZ31_9BACT|nr:hypothetical protein BSZ37_05680 [Rubrivirga marina]